MLISWKCYFCETGYKTRYGDDCYCSEESKREQEVEAMAFRDGTYASDWSALLHTSKRVIAWLDRLGAQPGYNGIDKTISVANLRDAIKAVEVRPIL